MELKGIDVSKWNGKDIDWKAVKESGIDFVIIKAGGGDDNLYKDSAFEINYTGAKAAGLKVGCYFFCSTDMDTAVKGRTQAEYFASIIKGKQFEFPVYADIEAQKGSKAGITNAAIAFGEYMESVNGGYWFGIYGSDIATFTDKLDYDKVKRFTIWCARYYENSKCVHAHDIRQYSDKGSVSGISGNVDLNYAYKDFEKDIKARGLNGWGQEVAEAITVPAGTVHVRKYKRGDDIQLTKNFHLSEFVCKCGKCQDVYVDDLLIEYLQAIRDYVDVEIFTNSCYRCKSHNAAVGGGSSSYHLKGRAADIRSEKVAPAELAKIAEGLGIKGIGLYSWGIHIDTRTTKFFWYSDRQEPRTTFGGKPIQTEKEDRIEVEESKEKPASNPTDITTESVKLNKVIWGSVAASFNADLAGSYSVNTQSSGLYCRSDAGSDKTKMCVLQKGDFVRCSGCYTEVDGVKWLQIQAYVDGAMYTGFSSEKYLKKLG